jgi:hypothetical protein
MSCYERLVARRQERDKVIEFCLFCAIIFGAAVYFGAHVLASVWAGRF